MASPEGHITIEVLFSPVCTHVVDAEREIERAIRRMDAPEAEVRFHEVVNLQDARDSGFIGSPTVRVNGSDVQHSGAETSPDVDTCRDYVGPHGEVLPYPPASLVEDAIRAARE